MQLMTYTGINCTRVVDSHRIATKNDHGPPTRPNARLPSQPPFAAHHDRRRDKPWRRPRPTV
jgi:hypothetical protein